MYRYSADNAVTYTSEDIILFRESKFACWMERLTLENPEHGIPPDLDSQAPENAVERQDDIAETLRAEGKDVSLIDWDEDEPLRRSTTLQAMREGVDFIVNGQLALGPLSGSANLLMRTSGYSELGDFLYIPCDTQAKTDLHSAFRLCFLADLLHSLQGQLPPQMLIIRGGDDLIPLQTEDHIYHYRAVKHLFMDAMRNFRKHRMPDPAESTHFGRWSDCAHEVLKQRVLREEQQARQPGQAQEQEEDAWNQEQQWLGEEAVSEQAGLHLQQAVGADSGQGASVFERDSSGHPPSQVAHQPPAATAVRETVADRGAAGSADDCRGPQGPTLVEQARMLTPGTYSVGKAASRFPPLARPSDTEQSDPASPGQEESGRGDSSHHRRASDAALQNLEFVGASKRTPLVGVESLGSEPPPGSALSPVASTAPAPSLRDPRHGEMPVRPRLPAWDDPDAAPDWDLAPESDSVPQPHSQPDPDSAPAARLTREDETKAGPPYGEKPNEEGSARVSAARSVIDMDDSHPVSPPPVLSTAGADFEFDAVDDDLEKKVERDLRDFVGSDQDRERDRPARDFSNTLMTSDAFED